MDALAWYFIFGVGTTLIALAMLIRTGRAPVGWKGIAAVVIGAIFWPLAILSLWYERQKAVWTIPELPPKLWLKEPERSGKYSLHPRIQVIVKHSPRRIQHWHGLTLLVRPRPTIDAPAQELHLHNGRKALPAERIWECLRHRFWGSASAF